MKPRILYDNRLGDTGTALVASSTAAGYHADNVIDWRPYTFWQGVSPLPATLTVDCLSSKSANYLMVYGHDLFTKGNCTVEVRGSTDNFAASNVLVHSFQPTTDRPFVRTFTAASYRYWRLRIDRVTGAGPMPSIAIAAIGTIFEPDGYLGLEFDPIGRREVSRFNRNENGQPLGKVLDYTEWEQAVVFRHVSWTWLRSTFMPVWDAHLRLKPFGFQWNANTDTEPRLVSTLEELRTPHRPGRQCDVSFTITGVIE